MTEDQLKPSIVVGIGASAGGLAVIKTLAQSLQAGSRISYLVVQHLDPTHESLLADIIGKHCALPVTTAEDGEQLEPDHLYVIPPGAYLKIRKGRIRLASMDDDEAGTRRAVDHLFRSLAEEYGERTAGVILSGSGSDGTAGLRVLQASGGLTLAQDPELAEHAGMPGSAVRARVIDKVVKVEELGGILRRFAEHPTAPRESTEEKEVADAPTTDAHESLEEIAAILQTRERFDLTQYKPGTILRRIVRRMNLTETESYRDYLETLRESSDERELLSRDLLINVTDFFRDTEAFAELEKNILPELLEKLEPQEDLRVWVPGCATGEEAYTLAMILVDAMERAGVKNELKIFATDIDGRGIETARQGVYPESIAREVPERLLKRYLRSSDDGHSFSVRSGLRDLISFATQNVASDPPFNHVHLISCRNLLIYLKKEIQERVLSSFYFALEDTGFLFLGSSENLGSRRECFRTRSKKWRIFQKIPGRFERRWMLSMPRGGFEKKAGEPSEATAASKGRQSSLDRADSIRLTVFEATAPPMVVVDEHDQVVYTHGDLRPFMALPQGEMQNDIARFVHSPLRSRLRSGLFKVRRDGEPAAVRCSLPVEENGEGGRQGVRLEFSPLPEQDFADGLAISISFHLEVPGGAVPVTDAEAQAADAGQAEAIEQELLETRQELQSTVEELETSTEELKAAHEEALSTNEELQSSNEELEASAEELRSLNEELSTVNAQLKEKIELVKRARDDLENFFASTDIPTLFLDPDLRIQRFTPAAEFLLRVGPADKERRVGVLATELVDVDLETECRRVLNDFRARSCEITTSDGTILHRQITPYRTEDRRVAGVVLVFQDISELKRLQKRAENRERQQAVVAKLGILALGGASAEDLMHQAVRQVAHALQADFCKVLRLEPGQQQFRLVSGIGWQEGLVGEATVPNDKGSQAGYTLVAGEPVLVDHLANEKRFAGPGLLLDHGVQSGMSCLINHSDPPYGVLGVHHREPRQFTSDDANFIQSVANMLSAVLRGEEAVEALRESERKFRTLANSIPQLAWMTDAEGYIFWFNERWFEFTGTTLKEMDGWGWQSVHHPDHVDRVVAHLKESFAKGEAWEDTFPLRGRDGHYRWFLSRAHPIRNDAGNIVNWFGTNTDITEKLEREEALRRSEERLRLAKDSGRLGLFDFDIANDRIEWEPLLRDIWGLGPEVSIDLQTVYAGIHPDDVEKTKQAVAASMDPEGDGHYEGTYRVVNRRDGQTYHIRAFGTTLFADGAPQRLTGLVQDITEQENTRRQLARSEERLRFTLEVAKIGVWELNLDEESARGSIEHDRILGYTEPIRDWSLERFLEQVHADDRETAESGLRGARDSGDCEFECRITRASDQAERWIWCRGRVVGAGEGTAGRMIGVVLDITRHKELEQSLRRAIEELRLADRKKNDFLSVLGHELRNPLAAIRGSLTVLQGKPSERDDLFQIMDSSVTTMARLLDDLLDLRRVSENKIKLDRERLDLEPLLRRVLRQTQSQMDAREHRVEADLDASLWVEGDAVRLEQIFTNLLINAAKYSPSQSEIVVQSRMGEEAVEISVRDTGDGLKEEDIEQIFEPFYQVDMGNGATSGLGIGLALSRRIAELHGGTLQARSEGVGKGSTFILRLQAAEAPPESGSTNDKTTDIRPGLRVLLVEDDPSIRRTMDFYLKTLKCEVTVASDAEEALECFGDVDPEIILMDLGLPGMGGHDAARGLRERGYDRKLVAISGYSHEDSRRRSKEAGFDLHLAKPVDPDGLKHLLSKA